MAPPFPPLQSSSAAMRMKFTPTSASTSQPSPRTSISLGCFRIRSGSGFSDLGKVQRQEENEGRRVLVKLPLRNRDDDNIEIM